MRFVIVTGVSGAGKSICAENAGGCPLFLCGQSSYSIGGEICFPDA